ncbi:MAG: winged helix-turn-helix domain-containing protein, partial [Mycobacterium sp.]
MAQILQSKREALYHHLREEITTGRYAPGVRLPSEAELGRLHGVSRTTVRVSLARLEAEHLIAVGQGARPVVLKPVMVDHGLPAVGDLVVVLGHDRLTNPVTQA